VADGEHSNWITQWGLVRLLEHRTATIEVPMPLIREQINSAATKSN
jgi:hypothetical protein